MTDYTQFADLELLDLIKGGNRYAFTEVYNRYWDVLYRHARRLLQDGDEAEDVIQEAFVHFLKKAPALELNGTLSSYLYATVKNRILNQMEHSKVKEKYIDSIRNFVEAGTFQADYLVRERQLAEIIDREIAALPTAVRESFELSRRENLTYREIATQLNIPESTVRNNISKALKLLRTKFGPVILIYLFLNG